MKKSECPEKLEPAQLNHEARQKLCEQITERKKLLHSTLIYEVKYACDQLIFAENSSLDRPMSEIIGYLKEARTRIDNALTSFQLDLEPLDNLVGVAREIRESEQ